MKRYSWCWDDMAEGEDGDYYDCEEVDRRIAELEAEVERLKAEVELHMNGAARVASRAQKAEAQRDRLAEALRPFVLHAEHARAVAKSSTLNLPDAISDGLQVTDAEVAEARAALAELVEKR